MEPLEAFRRRCVLVTGAGGFIGSHLVEALAAAGARVRAMLRYTVSFRHGCVGAENHGESEAAGRREGWAVGERNAGGQAGPFKCAHSTQEYCLASRWGKLRT